MAQHHWREAENAGVEFGALHPKRTSETRTEPERENKPRESEARKEVKEPPKPVINAQGQVTGRTLNVTA